MRQCLVRGLLLRAIQSFLRWPNHHVTALRRDDELRALGSGGAHLLRQRIKVPCKIIIMINLQAGNVKFAHRINLQV